MQVPLEKSNVPLRDLSRVKNDFRQQALAAWRHTCPGAVPSETPAADSAAAADESAPSAAHATPSAPSNAAAIKHEAPAQSSDSPQAPANSLPGSGKVRKTARKSAAKRPKLTLARKSAAQRPSDAAPQSTEQAAQAAAGSTERGSGTEPSSAQQTTEQAQPYGNSKADVSAPAAVQIKHFDPLTLTPRGKSRKQAAPARPVQWSLLTAVQLGSVRQKPAVQPDSVQEGADTAVGSMQQGSAAAVQGSTQQNVKPVQQPTWPEEGSAQTSDMNAPEPSDATSPETKRWPSSVLRGDSYNESSEHEIKRLLGVVKVEPGTEGSSDEIR